MADLHAWRDASRELPPEGVPVWMMDGDGTVSIFETFRDDDGAVVWAVCEYAPWWTGLALNPSWHAAHAYYEGDRVARYWHPLPDVPTLAELDAAHVDCLGEHTEDGCGCPGCAGQGVDTTDADLDAFVGRYGNALRGLAANPVGPAADAASGGGE